jgi:signal transduction histidine kinase
LVAYAIIEHGLLNVQLVLRRGTVYALLSGSLTAVYLSLVALLQRLFGHYGMQENVAFYTAAFPVTVVLAPSMKSRIEPFVDHALFRDLPQERRPQGQSQDMTLMGVLATEMTHELIKPLTHIMNAGSRLENAVTGRTRENLRTIEKEVQRASEILDGFAMLSPERTLHRIAVSVEDLIDEAMTTLGVKEDSSVRVIRRYDPLPRIFLNPGQIVQVLTNLIQNAWQAMPDGGELLIALKSVFIDKQSRDLEISISDTGDGIPFAIQQKIFEPFFTTKQSRGGRGMGLTISRAMVERHEGMIAVQSPIKAGRGTRMIVRLPMSQMEESS